MKRRFMEALRAVTIWLNKYFDETDLLHFKSNNGKYIYLVLLGHHCPDREKFHQIFPDSTQITEAKFNRYHKEGVEIVVVGDKADIDNLNNTNQEAEVLKIS